MAPGAAVTALVNKDIIRETTSSLDTGLNLGFSNNELGVEAGYFNRKTTDIVVQLPISNILGNKIVLFKNVGEMKSNGFELAANCDNLEASRDRLGFNVRFNFTYMNNEVIKFQGGNSPDQLYLIRERYPYKALRGYKAIGIYQPDREAVEHMYDNGYKPVMDNSEYEDINNDGKLDYRDKQVLGNTIPKIAYGISVGLCYKGLDLSLSFQGLRRANVFTQNEMTRLGHEYMRTAGFWRGTRIPENSGSSIPMP